MKRPWEQPKFVYVILKILWLPSQPIRKSAWNIQSSYGLYWQSSGHQQNWYEKNSWHNHSSYSTYSRRFIITDLENWYEQTLGTARVLISYLGNLMVTIATDMKISLQQTARCTEIASVVQTLFDQQLNS